MAKKNLTPEQALTNQLNAEIAKRSKLEAKNDLVTTKIYAQTDEILGILGDEELSEAKKIKFSHKKASRNERLKRYFRVDYSPINRCRFLFS